MGSQGCQMSLDIEAYDGISLQLVQYADRMQCTYQGNFEREIGEGGVDACVLEPQKYT